MPTPTRVAVVTGSTRGIGREIARALARQGLTVVVTGRDEEEGQRVARELGEGHHFQTLDVAQPESVDTLTRVVTERFGGLDVLVNNTGVALDGFDAKVARRTLDVNFVGTLRVTDRLLPSMRDGGRIVMVSSGMGEISCLSPALRKEIMDPSLDRKRLLAFADRFVDDVGKRVHSERGWPANAYRVSKVLMNAYVRLLARELEGDPRSLLVNAACPGWVRTAMGGSSAPRSPSEGAKTPVWLATLPAGGPTGGFFRDEQPIAW